MKIIVTAFLGGFMLAGLAHAQVISPETNEASGWQACNETSFILRVAAAAGENVAIEGKGWTRLRPGACTLIDLPLDVPRYIYAESSPAHQGGIREWKGSELLCTSDADFNAQDCADDKLRSYRKIAEDEKTSYLVEADNYGRRAETAGLQRLLKDTGYKVSRIDGVSGRRTLRTAAAFLKDNKLSANLNADKQIDALEKKALEGRKNTGFTVCNQSSHKIWVAVGHRYGGDWESRGWWSAKPGDCVQTITKSLKDLELHYFARQEQPGENKDIPLPDKILRHESAKATQFCISDAIFTARGRETCLDDGYAAANFRAVSVSETRAKATVTDADFTKTSMSGLRR